MTADEPFGARPPYLFTVTHSPNLEPRPSATAVGKPRRPLRPLHGIPERDRRGAQGFLLSALLHLAILLALALPTLIARQLDLPLEAGGGGPGPAGGGGGGSGGTGGALVRPERLEYLQVAPAKPAPTPTVVPPPVEKKPEVIPPPPPPIERQPEPVAAPVIEPVVPPASLGTTIPTAGTGGGTGKDGTAGTGPGSGGGVGSGVGTGRGSGTGPGTGGGPGDIYPPQVTNLAILPIPVPSKVRPYKLVAYFDVDETGKAKLISFNPSRDGGYNKKIREMLAEVRFRPAVRWDGKPVRDTAWITAEAPR